VQTEAERNAGSAEGRHKRGGEYKQGVESRKNRVTGRIRVLENSRCSL
jgi:hypothetical protein